MQQVRFYVLKLVRPEDKKLITLSNHTLITPLESFFDPRPQPPAPRKDLFKVFGQACRPLSNILYLFELGSKSPVELCPFELIAGLGMFQVQSQEFFFSLKHPRLFSSTAKLGFQTFACEAEETKRKMKFANNETNSKRSLFALRNFQMSFFF